MDQPELLRGVRYIYCGGQRTFARWMLGRWYCANCGSAVRVVENDLAKGLGS